MKAVVKLNVCTSSILLVEALALVLGADGNPWALSMAGEEMTWLANVH